MHVSGVLDNTLRSQTCAFVGGVSLAAQIALEISRPMPHKWTRLSLSACTNGTVAFAVLAVGFGSWQILSICNVFRLPALVLAVAEVCMSAVFTAVVLHGDAAVKRH